MKIFKRNLVRYADAGLPILYVDTLEDDRAEKIIRELSDEHERDVIEWSLSGAWDFSGGQVLALPKADLATTLQLLIANDDLNNTFTERESTSRKIPAKPLDSLSLQSTSTETTFKPWQIWVIIIDTESARQQILQSRFSFISRRQRQVTSTQCALWALCTTKAKASKKMNRSLSRGRKKPLKPATFKE